MTIADISGSACSSPTGEVGSTPTVAAVIVTRNRPDLLRRTLVSFQATSHAFHEVIVSDDSTNTETLEMLQTEFPHVLHVEGPKRGISANRNKGMSMAKADYILLSDDDMLLDSSFVELAVAQAAGARLALVFCAVKEHDQAILPNALNFLGFSTKPYQLGTPYATANQQCFFLSRQLALEIPYDEIIESYGYEEMDFAYRVAAHNVPIHCLPYCVNTHLAPNGDKPFRFEQDACRLYVTYKRLAYIDRRRAKALLFLLLALPHHLVASVIRSGVEGIRHAMYNFRLAFRMLARYSADRVAKVSRP